MLKENYINIFRRKNDTEGKYIWKEHYLSETFEVSGVHYVSQNIDNIVKDILGNLEMFPPKEEIKVFSLAPNESAENIELSELEFILKKISKEKKDLDFKISIKPW